jgi:hypothetical protein
MNAFQKFWEWLTDLIQGNHYKYPSNTQDIIGYGLANTWHKVDALDLAKRLRKNGLNSTTIELLGYAEDNYYNNPSQLYGKFDDLMDAMRCKKVLVKVNILNNNMCPAQYNSAWFQGILDHLNKVGTEGIMLQSVAEWDMGTACYSKLKGFEAQMAASWSGQKSWNSPSRPTSAPAGYTIEYHSLSTNDPGPVKCVVNTDTTSILNEFGGVKSKVTNPSRLTSYVKSVRNKGNGFVFYQYADVGIDDGAIGAIAQALK